MTDMTQIVERDYNATEIAPTARLASTLDFYYAAPYRNVTEPLDETRSIEMDADLYARVLARIERP